MINIVDLFSGCGGLSLGFEASGGGKRYRTRLALDNWPSALRILNSNHKAQGSGSLPIGRLADLEWFDSPGDVLLYYLVHLGLSNDGALLQQLHKLGLVDFLAAVRAADQLFARDLDAISSADEYSLQVDKVDAAVFSLASCRSVLQKLHLTHVRSPRLDSTTLSWVAEYDRIDTSGAGLNEPEIEDRLTNESGALWDRIAGQVRSSSQAVARGQHSDNPKRMESLAEFLSSYSGELLRAAWIGWHSRRTAVQDQFVQETEGELHRLYDESRRVHVILGGPPCKGFSRIGRAVIRELRSQGAHAWASDAFGDERNALMYRYVLFVEALKPDVFLFENVSNFQSILKTPDGQLDASALLAELIESISTDELHYLISHRVVHAKHHGIPQARQRFIMCGVNAKKATQDTLSHIFAIRSFPDQVPLSYALLGLGDAAEFTQGGAGVSTGTRTPTFDMDTSQLPEAIQTYVQWIRRRGDPDRLPLARVDSHIFRRPRADDALLYELFPSGTRWMDMKVSKASTLALLGELCEKLRRAGREGRLQKDELGLLSKVGELIDDSLALRLLLEHMSDHLGQPHHLLSSGYLQNGAGRHGDWLERLAWNRPSKTIVAHIGKDTYGYIHPYEPRPITIREAARIQSFPDDFSFAGVGVVDAYSMIGNAVPPMLADAYAETIWSAAKSSLLFSSSEYADLPERGRSPKDQITLGLVTP